MILLCSILTAISLPIGIFLWLPEFLGLAFGYGWVVSLLILETWIHGCLPTLQDFKDFWKELGEDC
jgi:hypothetical protein